MSWRPRKEEWRSLRGEQRQGWVEEPAGVLGSPGCVHLDASHMQPVFHHLFIPQTLTEHQAPFQTRRMQPCTTQGSCPHRAYFCCYSSPEDIFSIEF